MNAGSRDLELLVAKIQKQLAPQAEVLHNVRLDGRLTGAKRQIDVLVREYIGQYEIQIVIDCKDYNKPVDVKGVEELMVCCVTLAQQKGEFGVPKGFTGTAKKRAEGYRLICTARWIPTFIGGKFG